MNFFMSVIKCIFMSTEIIQKYCTFLKENIYIVEDRFLTSGILKVNFILSELEEKLSDLFQDKTA